MELSGTVSLVLDRPATKEAPASGEERLARWILAAALLVGLTRFLFLGRWSLWLDEAFTLADARHGYVERNPLGYLLFEWFYALSDQRPDETWMRMPAALCGWLSILACTWSFRPFYGPRAAALAALFVACSGWHVYWSQNARFYTLAQLLALAGGGALLRGLSASSSFLTGAGLAALVLSPLAHPSAALLVGPLLLVPWFSRWLDYLPESLEGRRSWKMLSTVGFVGVLVGIGWALQVWSTWEKRQGVGDPFHFAQACGYLITPTLGLAFAWGLMPALRSSRSFAPTLATLLALSAAGLASFFVRVSAQYVFVVLPWLSVVAAVPFARVRAPSGRLRRWLQPALLGLVLLPGLLESVLYFGMRNGDRPRWREAYRYVFEHRGADDLVLGMEAPVAEYYLAPQSDDLRHWKTITWLDDYRARQALDWARYGRRVWYVVNEEQLQDWRPENRADVNRLLAEECELQASFTIPFTPRNLDVKVYRTK